MLTGPLLLDCPRLSTNLSEPVRGAARPHVTMVKIVQTFPSLTHILSMIAVPTREPTQERVVSERQD